jgi:acetylornithine/succinyldiaminopimelate/putrescine aminotransferase/predicted amino acid dehydrogenase/phosphohistidine swiveling domain-containing protein
MSTVFSTDVPAYALALSDLPDPTGAAPAIGRKAMSLAELLGRGLPVPPAFAVTTAAYREALRAPEVAEAVRAALGADDQTREAAFERVRAALETAPLPDALTAAVTSAYAALGRGAVAVRSSGTAEDLAGASFAGMYETFLNIEGDAAVIQAVRHCWASAWTARVAAYAGKKGIDLEDLGMGVVVQRLVEAEVSGVMFTLDPMTGREEHLRVESCFGLGEALVAGKVQPDRYVIARRDGHAVETEIAHKAMRMVRRADGGVAEEALDETEGRKPTLTDDHLAELAALARRVQAHYGTPQDVEWVLAEGRIQLVQSRPITSMSHTGIDGEWTTADFKDGGVSARVCSPYMASLYDTIFSDSMGGYLRGIKLLRHRDPIDWYRVFYGRPYWNVEAVKRCMHLVPGFNERNFDRDLGIEGLYPGDGVVVPVNAVTIAKALPVLFALEADYKQRLKTNQAFAETFDRVIAPRYDADPAALDRNALATRFRKLLREDYHQTEFTYFQTIYNTSNAKLDFKVELDKANRLGADLSHLNLLSGLQNVRHLDPLRDLWALAGRVHGDPALRAIVDSTPAAQLQDAILASPQAAFWAEMAAFLHAHRHHSVSELDITQPRWDEDPTFVIETLKAYVAGYDPARDPIGMNDKQHALYQAERRKAEAFFAQRGLMGKLAARSFFAKLELVRTYAWWREELRDRSSRMYAIIRRDTLAAGRLMAREGQLDKAEDVWFLEYPEAIALLERAMDHGLAQSLVAERREHLDGFRAFTNPNELGRRFAVGHRAEVAEGALVGIPCSPGVVTARVRVVPTIQDGGRLQPGEILVTKFTDPGWTTLFSAIAGVVTETGGILSHAAVIAREYGIPAVLAVPGATERLKDGDWVLLDGHAGTVTVVPAPADGGEPLPETTPAAEGVHPPEGGSPRPFEPATTLTGVVPARPDAAHYHTHARPEMGRLMKALGLDITYTHAEGDWMAYDGPGGPHRVVDLLGGYGANLFGHHHPVLNEAARQALSDRAPIMAQASCRAWAGTVAKSLSDRIGAETGARYVVTLTNSGAEAVEAALKHAELERHDAALESARRFRRRAQSLLAEAGRDDQSGFLREAARELGLPSGAGVAEALEAIARANEAAAASPPTFFALERAFHGKTTGASQVTYNPAYREPFSRIGVACEFLPASDEAAWRKAIARATVRTWDVASHDGRLDLVEKPWVNVSAILVEPLQGEGGIHPLAPEDATRLRGIADAHGIPIVVDEIQAGMGRTGRFLASSWCGLRGDYYTFAKALGGGIAKIGALAVDDRRYRPDFGVIHTSTFAEDDFSCRVAMAALRLLDEADVPARCQALGEHWLPALRGLVDRHPGVLKAVRGQGLILGLEFQPQTHSPSNVIRMLSDHGYLGYVVAGYLLHEAGFRVAPTLSATTTIRLEPSAFIDPAHLDRFVGAVNRLCEILEKGNACRLVRYVVGLADPSDGSPIEDFRGHPAAPRREAPRCEKRVAFLGHFISAKDAMLWEPSLTLLPPGAAERFQLATHRIFGPTIYDQVHVTSAIGETVHLSFIGINLTSKAIEAALRARDGDWVLQLIEEGVSKAKDAGCQVVGLGGYTSIVADNGKRLTAQGVTLTTGNSLTVGMGVAALRQGAAERGVVMDRACLGVIGATGNIGSVYARMMADEVPRLVLVGREAGSRLKQVACRIYEDALMTLASGRATTGVAAAIAHTRAVAALLAQSPDGRGEKLGDRLFEALAAELGDAAPIVLTADLDRLRACQLIVTASNSAPPLVYPRHLNPGPVVICDISVPEDVAPEVAAERPDVLVLKGGLVAVPNDPAYRIGGIPLPEGHAFACMSETLLLGLMGAREHFSYGPVVPEKVKQAMAWAELNGFKLGGFKVDRSY